MPMYVNKPVTDAAADEEEEEGEQQQHIAPGHVCVNASCVYCNMSVLKNMLILSGFQHKIGFSQCRY